MKENVIIIVRQQPKERQLEPKKISGLDGIEPMTFVIPVQMPYH